jgi:long-chain fatty acid transport protein
MIASSLISRLFVYTAIGAAIAGLALPHRAAAGSFYLQDQSVRGLGRAYSGEVADQGAASLWWNPASIARSGRELYIGEHTILTDATVLDNGSTITRPVPPAGLTTPVGGDPRTYNPIETGVLPNAAFAMPIGDRFAIGLSMAAPFDFTSSFASNSFARYAGERSRLTTIDIQATGAMRVNDWLDLGAALNSEYTSATLTGALPNLSPLLPDGQQSLTGDGWNFGYSLGAQTHFGRLELGASYKSAMDHDLDGNVNISGLLGPIAAANISTGGSAHFTTPWIATFGGRYHLTPRLTLNAQVERLGWSEFDAINVDFAGQTQSTPEHYQDTTSGAVGVDYAVNRTWTLRAGVGYDQTPTTTAFRDTRVPDGDRMLYTVGGSVKVRPNLTIDGAFGYVRFHGDHIDNSLLFYGGTAAQTVVNERALVGGEAELLSLGMRYNF